MTRKNRYWLWIIPSQYEGLWELCRTHDVFAMHFPPEYRMARKTHLIASEISNDDYVIAYLNKKTIGGFGRVIREVYEAEEDETWENETKYEWATRIDVDWEIVDNYGWQFNTSPSDLLGIPSWTLGTATIHEVNIRFFKRTKKWLEEQLKEADDSSRYMIPKQSRTYIPATDIYITERALQNFLVEHIEEFFGKGWGLFIDEEDIEGYEYVLGSGGVADLIVIDSNDLLTVVELKVIQAKQTHVDQLLGYVEEMTEEFEEDSKGILVAPGISKAAFKALEKDPRLKYISFQLFLGLNL